MTRSMVRETRSCPFPLPGEIGNPAVSAVDRLAKKSRQRFPRRQGWELGGRRARNPGAGAYFQCASGPGAQGQRSVGIFSKPSRFRIPWKTAAGRSARRTSCTFIGSSSWGRYSNIAGKERRKPLPSGKGTRRAGKSMKELRRPGDPHPRTHGFASYPYG